MVATSTVQRETVVSLPASAGALFLFWSALCGGHVKQRKRRDLPYGGILVRVITFPTDIFVLKEWFLDCKKIKKE